MNKVNFRELLTEYFVEIPRIQRDYAHGRDNERERKIIDRFLKDIKKELESGKEKTMHLDFIYGKVEKRGEKEIFLPIDGQQRLTLLFLLHVYIAKRDNEDVSFLKNRFSYKIRSSSREFCEKLVEKDWNVDKNKENVNDDIKNYHWFSPAWLKDPTVKSMLNVLDKIHNEFRNSPIKLSDLERITFEVFDLRHFQLDEELYIRMNSRGKPLTDFEIWKARFESFLDKTYGKELQRKFSNSIDGKWNDFFWWHGFRKEEKVDGENYYSTDENILNFFRFITEMLGYTVLNPTETNSITEEFYNLKENKKLSGMLLEEEIISYIYSTENKENINLLFSTFNNLELLKELSQKIFGPFYEREEDYESNKSKLPIVQKNQKREEDADLFSRCIKSDDLNLVEKTVLFALIYFLYLHCPGGKLSNKQKENLKDFLRVIRNVLFRIRFERRTEVKYELDLRREDMYSFINNFMRNLLEDIAEENVYDVLSAWEENELEKYIFSSERISSEKARRNIFQEVKKAKLISEDFSNKEYIHKLEDHVYLKGDLSYFLDWDDISFKEKAERFYETFEKEDKEIIPALLSLEVENYPYRNGDRKFFFGRKGYWEILVTREDDNGRKIFEKLWRELFTHPDFPNFEKMRKDFLKNAPCKDWRYYFVKYPEIYEEIQGENNIDRNIFLTPPDILSEPSVCMEKLLRKIASGNHINPFIWYVCNQLGIPEDNIHFGRGIGEENFYSCITFPDGSQKRLCPIKMNSRESEDLIEGFIKDVSNCLTSGSL